MFATLEEAILKILEKQERLEDMLSAILQINWSIRDVANYLNKSTKTIENYVKEGKFQEGVHYVRKNKRLYFFPNSIIEFKKDLLKPKKIKKVEKQLHPITKKFVNFK